MTDRNGNLNENSRSGSREDGREPVRRNTAMNSREIMLEDEDYLDEPDEGYLDDDYFDRDMEERILREAELDMENIHQPERQDQNRWEEPERLPEKEPEEIASRKRSRARGNQSAGTGREAAHAAPQRGQNSGKTASWTETTPEKAALKAEHRKTTGKKTAWIAACTAGILLVAAGGVYAGMSQKYKTRFFPNTQINGVDASGKTAAEVQELIAEGVNGYTLTITERNNQTETIAGTDIKLHAEFDGSLEKMVAAQNPFAWLGHVKQEEYTIGTMVAYDDAALESQIRNLSCLDPGKVVEPVNAKISEYVSGQGYSIEPEQEGTAVEAEKLTQAVTGAIENLQDHLSLEEADVYKKPTVLKDDASLAEQLDNIFTDIYPDAVKIGMVSSSALIETIAKKLHQYDAKNIVVDPVMVATSGAKLINDEAIDALKSQLLPMATVLTPNIPEAEVLSGMKIETADDMIKAAAAIGEKYHCAVLCKGGHQLNDANDLLWRDGGYKWFQGKRINNPNTHGTGCTLSSAIASNLAKGFDLDTSVERAKKYISGALAAMLDLGKGSGPMNHGFAIQNEFTLAKEDN